MTTSLTFEQLADLRQKTETISQFLESQLREYLEVLRPLLAPGRLLGRYVGVKDEIAGAERALATIREKYKEVCRKPFALVPELHEDTLTSLDTRLELYPCEYTHEAKTERESKTLTIRSPMRWVLTYGSGYTLAQLRQAVAGQDSRQTESIRQFVIHAVAMYVFFKTYPNIARLLSDLRYDVQVEPLRGLGDLPFVTIRSSLASFRPSDDLLLTATRFSGVSAFVELIDVDSVCRLTDPLKLRIDQILGNSTGSNVPSAS